MAPGTKTLLCSSRNKSLDGVLALDANDAVPDNEVVKEAEAAILEGEAVGLPEVYEDRNDEATLRDVVTEEVLVPRREHLRPGGVLIASGRARVGGAL